MSRAEDEIPEVFKQYLNESGILDSLSKPGFSRTRLQTAAKKIFGIEAYQRPELISEGREVRLKAGFAQILLPSFNALYVKARQSKEEVGEIAGKASFLTDIGVDTTSGLLFIGGAAEHDPKLLALAVGSRLIFGGVAQATPQIYERIKSVVSNRPRIVFHR